MSLRIRCKDWERKYDQALEQMRLTVTAFEQGEDLTRRMAAMARMTNATDGLRWTPDLVIAKLREWTEMYGEPPTKSEWNPSKARSQGRPEIVGNFYAGDWPHAQSVVNRFGSWNRGLIAAGLPIHDVSNSRIMRRAGLGQTSPYWPIWGGWQYMRVARERTGMTQSEVAARTHLSLTWISRVERGATDNIVVRALLAYAKGIGVPATAFLEEHHDN